MSNSRLEKFIYAICSMEVSDLPAPLSRIEILWNCLITGETPDFEPQSRNEQYLMAMLGLYELENLPTPMSRGEKLLYKIAMGETDLSDIPAYLSRYEELLGYLAENGGVGDFEYILQTLNQRLSTLYSTKERPMKQAVIKGDTLVNELPRPTLKNTMTNAASQKLNQGYDTVNAVDGEFKSAILKGQTLVNLASASGATLSNNKDLTIFRSMYKNSTPYTFIVTTDKDCETMYQFYDGDTAIIDYVRTLTKGVNKHLFTSPSTNFTRCILRNRSTDDVTFSNIMVIEGDYTNVDISYFTGMQSVKMPVLTTTGKNLYKDEGGTKNSNIDLNTGDIMSGNRFVPNSYTRVFGGEKYTLYRKLVNANIGLRCYDVNKNFINSYRPFNNSNILVFTAPSNCYYVKFIDEYNSLNNEYAIYLGDYSSNFSYEPYKSNILSTSENVILRKVGDVEDEFDALTGQVTERVGEIVLDGSENWRYQQAASSSLKRFVSEFTINNAVSYHELTDYFPTNGDQWNNDVMNLCIDLVKKIVLQFNSSDNRYNYTLDQFKQWLSQNPITVQYQLATPTTKTVNTTITNQDGVTQTKLHSFNDGYLSVSSQGLLPSAVNYEVPTNNSYYLPDMLTLDAQYTSRGSADCNATIDGKLLALGKNRIFTTPSSVTDKLMVLDAPVDDLMFIKGDHTAKDFGYFEGMKSVVLSNKMPVLKTTGKNLLNPNYLKEQCLKISSDSEIDTNENIVFHSKAFHQKRLIALDFEPNTQYAFNLKMSGQPKTQLHIKVYYTDNTDSLHIPYIADWTDTISGITKANATVDYISISYGNGAAGCVLYVNECSLFKSDTVMPHEPYKSNILTVNEDVELRGIGDVRDELDCLTGEVVKKFNKVILTGNEQYIIHHENDNFIEFYSNFKKDGANNRIGLSNFIPYHNSIDNERICVSPSGIFIRISKTRNLISVESFKNYLASNPIEIIYNAITESIKTVDLTTVDQDGQPTKLKTFNDITYVKMNADNIIPSVDVEIATKISGTLATLDPQQLDISNTQNKLGQTIDEQSENTDATMMATTEIYEQTL